MKRFFYTRDFAGFYPVGTSAIVLAKDKQEAWELLAKAIEKAGLDPDESGGFTVHELTEGALVLQDGEY